MKRCAFALLIASAAWAQVAAEANAHYRTKEGREVLARGLSRQGRDTQQKPREIVDALGLRPGMTVADIGTGTGYMLPFLSEAVGPQGRVLAEDIFEDFLNNALSTARKRGLRNVEIVLGTDRDPRLPPGKVDIAFALESYHHWDYPQQMLAAIRAALTPDGRLAIVDYYRREGAMAGGDAMHHIRIDRDAVIEEIQSAGFRLVTSREHIPGSQYLLIFAR